MESLLGLDLVANTATPISAATQSFFINTFAGGSGPDGTYLLTDLLGSATGLVANPALSQASSFITANQTGSLSALNTLYGQMVDVVDGNYGLPPTITIPSGPAAGAYTTYDDALEALILASNNELGNVITAVGTANVAAINTSWYAMASQWVNEPTNQTKAQISIATISTSAQLPITSFMTGLNGYGQDTQTGMSAQVLESVANVSSEYGQALVGALREGRNNQNMDATGIGHDNASPSVPPEPPPQATLSDSQYTVAQARAAAA